MKPLKKKRKYFECTNIVVRQCDVVHKICCVNSNVQLSWVNACRKVSSRRNDASSTTRAWTHRLVAEPEDTEVSMAC